VNAKNINLRIKSRSDCIFLRGFFDIHAGVKACDFDRFKADVEEVRKTPNMYAFLGGDMCDFISPDDRRFDSQTLTPEVLLELNDLPIKMARQVIDVLMPIKHKLLFGLEGNHEKSLHDHKNIDVASYICTSLGIPNLGYTGLVRLTFQRSKRALRSITLYASHGFGSSIKFGGKMNRLIDCIQMVEADIYFMGHNHGKGVAMVDRFYATFGTYNRVVAHHKVCILGGTYLRTYMKNTSSYGERKGYSPAPIGCMTVKIKPFNNMKIKGKAVEMPVNFSVESSTDMTDEFEHD
jgi:hypothetical protein